MVPETDPLPARHLSALRDQRQVALKLHRRSVEVRRRPPRVRRGCHSPSHPIAATMYIPSTLAQPDPRPGATVAVSQMPHDWHLPSSYTPHPWSVNGV